MSGDAFDLNQQIEAVAQRADFLELLDQNGPLQTRDIVDRLDHSRSTVTRALRTLRDADLVKKSPTGYEITSAGALATEQYRRYQTASKAALKRKDVLHELPRSALPPVDVLIGAETFHTKSDAPVRAVETITDRVRGADSVQMYLPTLVDTHLLRVWHRAVVNGAVDSQAVFDPTLLSALKGQYPGLLSEMSVSDGFSAAVTEGPPYGLFLTEHDETATVSLIIFGDSTAVRGVITNTAADAVAWGRAEFARLADAATDVTPDLHLLDVDSAGQPVEPADRAGIGASNTDKETEADGHALPLALEAEGFVGLSPAYFQAHDCAPPAMSWRTGFTLSEINAGHAVDRADESGHRLSDRLIEGLETGDDHVLTGPPGSGKSTTCMTVACRWYDTDRGPVLYRGPDGDRIDSTALLKAYLRQTEGHTLVVVEEAVRAGTAAIFDVIQSLSGDSSVTFLLSSRQHSWQDAGDLATDARLDTYRRSALTQVTMPALTEENCGRFIEHFESLVDEDLGLTGVELFSLIEAGAGQTRDDRLSAGNALVAQFHISRHYEATSDEEHPTALDQAVSRVYEDVADASPSSTLELAVLVSTLNAASVPLAPEYLYTLAPEGALDDVDRARSVLEGTLLFGQESRRTSPTTTYRTRHETWSVRFLEEILDDLPSQTARETFGEVVSRLLALADDGEQRNRIRRHLDSRTQHLHRIEADPEGWADEVIRRVFQVGQTETTLAPLYGETAEDPIEIPDVCTDSVTAQTRYWRGYMNRVRGDFERAEREFRALEAFVDETELEADSPVEPAAFESDSPNTGVPDEDDTTDISEIQRHRWCAKARINLGILERERGNLAAAMDHIRAGQEQYRRVCDRHGEAEALKHLGATDLKRGELESATRALEESTEQFREFGDRHNEAKALSNLGICATMRGELETAADHFNRSLDQLREAGDRYNEAKVLLNMATNTAKQGSLSVAEEHARDALLTFREIGDRHAQATTRGELGVIARKQEDYEAALTHLETALELFREIGDRRAEAKALSDIGEVTRQRGEPTEALEYFDEALDSFRRVGDQRMEAAVLTNIGDAEYELGNTGAARSHYETSSKLFDEVGDKRGYAETCFRWGDLLYQSDAHDQAQTRLTEAAEVYFELDAEKTIDTVEKLIDLCEEQGNLETAKEWCQQASAFAKRTEQPEEYERFIQRNEELMKPG